MAQFLIVEGSTVVGTINLDDGDTYDPGLGRELVSLQLVAQSAPVQSLELASLASDPGSPVDGQLWYNSVLKKARFRSNAVIKSLGQMPFNGDVVTVDPTDPTADYASLESALAVVASGDVVLLSPGTHVLSGDITVPAGVRIQGTGRYGSTRTQIQRTAFGTRQIITVGSGASFADLHIRFIADFASIAVIVAYITSGVAYFERCLIDAYTTNATGGSCTVIGCDGGSVQLRDSEVLLTDGALALSTRRGVSLTTNAGLEAWNSRFQTLGQSIYLNHANASAELTGCQVFDFLTATLASSVMLYAGNYIANIYDPTNKVQLLEKEVQVPPTIFLPGDCGEDGMMGPPGPPGTGAPGATGAPGPTGPAVFVLGEQGDEGECGIPGAQGAPGKGDVTRIAGSSGGAGSYETWQELTSNSADNTSTTPAVVMTTTDVGVGTWRYEYDLIFQTAATTTGIGVAVNHTGTTTTFVMNSVHITTGGTAATGVSDGVTSTNAGQMAEGKAERVKNTVTTATAGVDTINANTLMRVYGTVIVTVSGSLELKISTEVGASAVRAIAGTNLVLRKISA